MGTHEPRQAYGARKRCVNMGPICGKTTLIAGGPESAPRRQRKFELASDQGDDFPLSVGIGLDVSGGCSQACVAGERLNVA
jgi:hypothetical protein